MRVKDTVYPEFQSMVQDILSSYDLSWRSTSPTIQKRRAEQRYKVVEMYYGVNGHASNPSWVKIGKEMGLSNERVRQIFASGYTVMELHVKSAKCKLPKRQEYIALFKSNRLY